ncbi:S8 family peptidase, partial [Candidatus Woesearchaeota archaeon]|nr:S8 family peptidase [Candidatus Woesearchaeota archaeon]
MDIEIYLDDGLEFVDENGNNVDREKIINEHIRKQDEKRLIIILHENEDKIKKAFELFNYFDLPVEPFQTLNSLHISFSAKEEKLVTRHLEKFDFISEIRKPGIVCIPEMVHGAYEKAKKVEATDSWNLEMLHSIECNSQGYGGQDIKVAVMDTGIDYNHNELAECFGNNVGYDFVNDENPMDREGHGTHVAGIIAGRTTGVAPEAELRAYKVLDDYGYGSEIDLIKAIDMAIKEDIDICNMSLGFVNPSYTLAEALEVLTKTSIVCAAAGNEAYEPCYPGDFDIESLISVAALDRKKKRPYWSRVSENNDISAPGVGIISCAPGGGYAEMSGTSMATPHAAGVAALLLQYNKLQHSTALTPSQIEDMLESTGKSVSYLSYTFSRIDPYYAIASLDDV